MRVVVTGAKGQLGQELQETLSAHRILAVDVDEFDITDRAATVEAIGDFRPEVVVHTAAYTDVDGCERNPELAHRVNAGGTENIALACKEVDAAMVYISTDFVFDGTKGSLYLEADSPNPLGEYARSKLAGERAVQSILRKHYITRTAWLYGRGRNFVRTIIDAAAQGRELFAVTDEIGSPTYAKDLAGALTRLIELPSYGVYHLVNEGACSRYELIIEILRVAGYQVKVTPMTIAEFRSRFPSPTRRPENSALLNCAASGLGIRLRPWKEALADFICTLR